MDLADALVFGTLAIADLCLMIHLRRTRNRRRRQQRMMRSLELAIQRENSVEPVTSVIKRWAVRRAS